MKQKGFTIIELLVVTAIFSVVIVVILEIFISTVKVQRYNLTSQRLIDEVSYILEHMSRSIRMAKTDAEGYNYKISADQGLEFINSKLEYQKFYRKQNEGVNKIYEYVDNPVSSLDLPITSNKFDIKKLDFVLYGESQSDLDQPKVTIILEAEGKGPAPQPKIRIQTTVSQRDLDMQ